MAIMRVESKALEHVLDLPEGVEIVDIERELAPDDLNGSRFIFHIKGENPESGDELVGEVMATYSQDETGVHFERFDRLD